MDHCADFSTAHYVEMLKKAKDLGYGIFSFQDWVEGRVTGPRTLLLRHDVDLSLDRFQRMVELEAGLGVRSTYFLRLHSGFYNLLEPDTFFLLLKMLDAGIDIGLHYEGLFYRNAGGDPVDWLKRDAAIFRAITGKSVAGCSAHMPASIKQLSMADALGAGLAYEAYAEPFTKERKYISDSSRHWREGCLCQWLGKADHLTVLTHPIWWFDLPDTPENIIAAVRTGK